MACGSSIEPVRFVLGPSGPSGVPWKSSWNRNLSYEHQLLLAQVRFLVAKHVHHWLFSSILSATVLVLFLGRVTPCWTPLRARQGTLQSIAKLDKEIMMKITRPDVHGSSTRTQMKFTDERHPKPLAKVQGSQVAPRMAEHYMFVQVQVTENVPKMIAPATWTLALTKTDCSKRMKLDNDVVIHLSPKCCGMSTPRPLMPHALFVQTMHWCIYCASHDGMIFVLR